jgi:hypothetical protein
MIVNHTFKSFAIALFCSLISSVILAQDDDQKKNDKELYRSSEVLYNKSAKALRNDDLVESEKLYYQSLKTYPIRFSAHSLAIKKMEIGDVKGANKIWDDLISALNSKPQVLYEHATGIGGFMKLSYESSADFIESIRRIKANENFKKGDARIAQKETMIILQSIKGSINTDDEKFLYNQAVQVCFFNDDFESMKTIHEIAKKANYNRGIFETNVYGLLIEKKYDEVISILNNTLNSGGENFMMSKGLAKTILPLAFMGKEILKIWQKV